MAELAVKTKQMDFHLEQVQDFTPTPMTISTEMWYTGYDPYTLEPVFSAKTAEEKQAQRMFFFWYQPEERRKIERELRRIGRSDLINQLYGHQDKRPFDKNRFEKSAGGRKGEQPFDKKDKRPFDVRESSTRRYDGKGHNKRNKR